MRKKKEQKEEMGMFGVGRDICDGLVHIIEEEMWGCKSIYIINSFNSILINKGSSHAI